jgi:hypothetical protein
MVTVVGRDESKVKRVTCRGCASVLEYKQSEVQSRHGRDISGCADGEMSEDEQEARSVKYHETYKIARLSSGHLAVFDYDFQLVGITDPLAFPFDIPARFHEPKTHYPAHEYATKSKPKSSARTPKPSTNQLLDLI